MMMQITSCWVMPSPQRSENSFVPCNVLPIRQLVGKDTMLNNMYLYAVLLMYCSALTAAPACTSL